MFLYLPCEETKTCAFSLAFEKGNESLSLYLSMVVCSGEHQNPGWLDKKQGIIIYSTKGITSTRPILRIPLIKPNQM